MSTLRKFAWHVSSDFEFWPRWLYAHIIGRCSIQFDITTISNQLTIYTLFAYNFRFNLVDSASRPERECPSRRYVFERHPRKKLKLPVSDIKEVCQYLCYTCIYFLLCFSSHQFQLLQITAANRSDCEDKCLNEFSFVCRSANYDSNLRSCSLSRFTRRTHPELMEDDPNSDYLENTCLNGKYNYWTRWVVYLCMIKEKIMRAHFMGLLMFVYIFSNSLSVSLKCV